jgi:DNA-binding transcriptional LysR family regulator
MNEPHRTDHGGALDWSLLQAFDALVEAGSIGRAARQLGVSQPTLSRRLAALEAQLGQPLFERTPGGIVPTATARALDDPARQMRAQAARLSLLADGHGRSLAGTVRLTASHAVCTHVLLPILGELRAKQPQIQIELVPSDRVEDLLGRAADVAIRMVRPTETSLIARRLADMPLGFYARRDYLRRHGVPRRETIAQHQWIGFDRYEAMVEGFAAAGLPVTREFFGLRCDNSAVNWAAVCAGLGIGVGMQAVAAADARVVRVLEDIEVPPLPAWLVVHRELRGSPRLRAVADALAQALRRA